MRRESGTYMAPVEKTKELTSFADTLRKRLAASEAVKVVNGLVSGEIQEISRTRFDAIKLTLNKCLPDLKAIEMTVSDMRPATKEDVDAMLLEAGLNPEEEYTNPSSPIEGEIVDAEYEDS